MKPNFKTQAMNLGRGFKRQWTSPLRFWDQTQTPSEGSNPPGFSDDEWRKLQGIEGVLLGLIDPGYSERINAEADLSCLAHQAHSLHDFVCWMEHSNRPQSGPRVML